MMKKRISAIIVCLAMVIAMLPQTIVFADTADETMDIKHYRGLVVSNGRYSLARDENGMLFSQRQDLAGASSIAAKEGYSQIMHEYSDAYSGDKAYGVMTIATDLPDKMLGGIVDVYFTADGAEGAYSNVQIVGDVLVNSNTVTYDVLAADIEMFPNGESYISTAIKPYMTFTTEDGTVKTIEPRAYYGDGSVADDSFTSTRVPQYASYYGAAFADRTYVVNSDSENLAQPEFDQPSEENTYNPSIISADTYIKKAVQDIGENQLRKYRFVSVDGGNTISYIFAMERMDYGVVSNYGGQSVTILGVGGTIDIAEGAAINGEISVGMPVVTYAEDGRVVIEPTEEMTGKATSFADNTATINGEVYRAAVSVLGDEIDTYFTYGNGKNHNHDGTKYVVYKDYILEVDGTYAAGSAEDYAVVLSSKYDTDTGDVTVRLGFADNTTGTYFVSKINSNEENNENLKWCFENNRMVGAVLLATIDNGMVDLSANDGDEIQAKAYGNFDAVINENVIVSINNGKFSSLRADENSLVFMIYGGQPVYSQVEVLPDGEDAVPMGSAVNIGDYVVEGDSYYLVKSFSALKSKAYKLSDVYNKVSAPVYIKVGAEGQVAAWNQFYIGDSVKRTSSDSLSTLVAGSISVGENAGVGIGETDNIAYLLKATENYSPSTEKWYLDVRMISVDGLIETRTVDDVCDADGNLIITERIGAESIERGSIVVYDMTEAEDESGEEWIRAIGTGDYGSIAKVYDYNASSWPFSFEQAGFYAVQIGIVDDEYIAFFPISHSQDGTDDNWADNLTVVEKDKYNFTSIAIHDGQYVATDVIQTINSKSVISAGYHNAIIVVDDEGEITRVFTMLDYMISSDGSSSCSGTCGESLTWKISADGVLTIEGVGAMDTYSADTYAPWHSYKATIKSISIEEGVTSVGDYAFSGCESVTNVSLPDSVTKIGVSAFNSCSSLTDIILPKSIASIGNMVFGGCTSLVNIDLPNGIKNIGAAAFASCSNLSGVDIPKGTESIGAYAFNMCAELAEISVPDTVTAIGDSAFAECNKLTISGYEGSTAQTYANDNKIAFNAMTKPEVITYSFGQSVQIGLIEPWFLKANLKLFNSATSKEIDYSTIKDYGVYFVRKSELGDDTLTQTTVTAEQIIENANTVKCTKADGSAFVDENIGCLSARYEKGIYTYELADSVFVMFYIEDANGVQYAPVRERNLYDLAKTRSADTSGDFGEFEKIVYGAMVDMYDAVTAYREDYFKNS